MPVEVLFGRFLVIYFARGHWYNVAVRNDAEIWNALSASRRLLLIAGPCVIESERLCLTIASILKGICQKLGIFLVFKASFDKANRTSAKSFRGPGTEQGLRILERVRAKLDLPILTD